MLGDPGYGLIDGPFGDVSILGLRFEERQSTFLQLDANGMSKDLRTGIL